MHRVYTIFDRLRPVICYASSLRMLCCFQFCLLSLEGKGMTQVSEGMIRIAAMSRYWNIMWCQGTRPRYYICIAACQPYFWLTPFSGTLCCVAEDVELSSSSTALVKYRAWWRFGVWTSTLDVYVCNEGFIVVCVIRFTEIVCIWQGHIADCMLIIVSLWDDDGRCGSCVGAGWWNPLLLLVCVLTCSNRARPAAASLFW